MSQPGALLIIITQGHKLMEEPAPQMLPVTVLERKESSKRSHPKRLNALVQKWHEALQLNNTLNDTPGIIHAWLHSTTRGIESVIVNN